MKNIFKIFSRDAARISSNVVALVIVMGLAIIPALYAWFNILSNWDPYGESATSAMKVAVYSADKGLSIGEAGLNVGDSVVDGLKANTTIGWVFCDTKEDALAGVYSGEYYAALVLPDNFTMDMISFLSGKPDHPVIEYYENSKKNAIATKITAKVKTTVQQTVNTTFVSTIAEYASKAGEILTSNSADTIDEAIDSLEDISDKLGSFVTILESFAMVTKSTGDVLASGQELIPDIQDMVTGTTSALGSIQLAILAGSNTMNSMITMVDYSLDAAKTALDNLQKAISAATSAADIVSSDIQNRIETTEALVEAALNAFASIDGLPGDADDYPEFVEASEAFKKLQQDVLKLQKDAKEGQANYKKLRETISSEITVCSNTIKSLQISFDYSISPQLNQAVYNIEEALINAQKLLGGVNGNFVRVDIALDKYQEVLRLATENIEQTAGYIKDLQSTLNTVVDSLKLFTDNEEYAQLMTLLSNDSTTIAEYVSSPVNMETVTIYEIDGYGSAMAPFYTVLALWVGALIMSALVHVKVAAFPELTKVHGFQEFFGRYLTFFLIGQAQSAITVLGNLHFVGIQCLHPFMFFFGCAVISMVFTMIMYGLTVAFGNIGQAIAVIIMVIQVAGAGCTFPIEVLPTVFQKIYQFLPFPYAMNLLKGCVGGFYENEYWINMGLLACFGFGFCLVGVLLRKPFERLNETIEKSKKKSGLLL